MCHCALTKLMKTRSVADDKRVHSTLTYMVNFDVSYPKRKYFSYKEKQSAPGPGIVPKLPMEISACIELFDGNPGVIFGLFSNHFVLYRRFIFIFLHCIIFKA